MRSAPAYTLNRLGRRNPTSVRPLSRANATARLEGAETDATVEMPAGELQIASGSPDLLDAHFSFDTDAGRPDVQFSEAAGRGKLSVKSLKNTGPSGQARWELRLAEGLPLDLQVQMGAGRAQLDLGALDLRNLRLNGGAGDLTLDLRGRPAHDYEVRVNGGVGRVRVYVPGRAGVRAYVNGGIGGVSTEGPWKKTGREYRTTNYDDAQRRINLHVNGGIGTIKLIADE